MTRLILSNTPLRLPPSHPDQPKRRRSDRLSFIPPNVCGSGPAGGWRMMWWLSHRADAEVVPLADRHYNRQKIGSPQFAPPGRCMVLKTQPLDAFWITSWPFAGYVKHEWAGAWVCSAFRNEGEHLSSILVRDAVAATLAVYGDAPPLGMITFVDGTKVRRKRDLGRCYRKAGFVDAGFTNGGLVALQLLPDAMPEAREPLGANRGLFPESSQPAPARLCHVSEPDVVNESSSSPTQGRTAPP